MLCRNRIINVRGFRCFLLSMAFVLLSGLVGCSFTTDDANQGNQLLAEPLEITVYSPGYDEQSFYKNYGNYIIQKYPQISFRFIKANIHENPDELVRDLDKYNPDLIISQKYTYFSLQEQGLLSDLSPFIKSDEISLDQYYPEMIKVLRDESGQLQGMSPSVYPSVIYYNKKLFEMNKLDFPSDQMTWEELLGYAARFSDSGVVGLTGLSPVGALAATAITNGWNIVDQDHKLVLDDEKWIPALEQILLSTRGGNIQQDTRDLFVQGKAAMYYGGLELIPKLVSQNDFAWGIATSPVDPLNRDVSRDYYFYDIFSIPQNAVHKEAAWEVIRNIMSEEAIPYFERNPRLPGGVPTIVKFMNAKYGADLSAIWKQRIEYKPFLSSELSTDFISQFDALTESILSKAAKDPDMTPEDCYVQIKEGSELLFEQELSKEGLPGSGG